MYLLAFLLDFRVRNATRSHGMFIQLKAIASAEYWIHFRVRFGSVHTFGYNSTESELIGMKPGAL